MTGTLRGWGNSRNSFSMGQKEGEFYDPFSLSLAYRTMEGFFSQFVTLETTNESSKSLNGPLFYMNIYIYLLTAVF